MERYDYSLFLFPSLYAHSKRREDRALYIHNEEVSNYNEGDRIAPVYSVAIFT